MERKLKDRMLEESRYPDTLKEELWARIDANLDIESTPVRSRRNRGQWSGKKLNRVKMTTGIAAASIAIAVFLSMPAGTALMKDIQEWFAPEKKVEVSVEGEKELTDQKLHQNEGAVDNGGKKRDGQIYHLLRSRAVQACAEGWQ